MDRLTGNSALACQLVDELGVPFLKSTFSCTNACVSRWKKYGMTELKERFLRQSYPNLKAFGGPGIPGISRCLKDA